MDLENQIIRTILGNFKKSPFHKNNFFESDAEIIQIGSQNILLTVDSFSEEDNFRTDDPYILGMNLAACTISDIFACGAKPLFFSNSLTKSTEWDIDYIDLLSKGISEILDKCDTGFVGGDLGSSAKWNYTGVCIGFSEKFVTRKGAREGDRIYITGEIGNGNFEAASRLFVENQNLREFFQNNIIKFPLRIKESEIVSKYASSSIDTSDGLFKSLSIIAEVNDVGFMISDIPYHQHCLQLTSIFDLPEEMLMFGESGEYELMFTIPKAIEEEFLHDIKDKNFKMYKIGEITNSRNFIYTKVNEIVDFSDFKLSARDNNNHFLYMNDLKNYILSKTE